MSFRYPVVMPKMSMTMETGELILYHVQPGDRVSSGDVLFEVMTDKIDMEVEAPTDGVIEQLIGEIGIDIPIGTPVLIMQTDTEVMAFDFGGEAPTIPAPPEAIVEPVVLPEPVIVPEPVVVPEPVIVPEPVRAEVGVKAVPKARIVAAQKGIDLQSVVATGPDNTIMLADVTQIRPSDEIQRRQSANKALIAKGLEMTRLIPQSSFSRTVSTSVDTAALLAAWASVLRSRPELNISPKDGSELSFVGVAVIIESKYGSALPVFKDPDLLGALELSELVSTTTSAAENGKVPLSMLSGATTTVFDLRRYHMSATTPLLFPNQLTSITVGENIDGTQIISLTIDLRYCDFYDGALLLDHLISVL